MTPVDALPPSQLPMSRRSMAIAAFSTVVEWYDFTLYLFLATVLSRVFYGGGEGSLVATLAGFAVAYLMRPLGAVVFGHFGDRFGRRPMMLISVGMMTAAMLATALLPPQSAIGPAAGWSLLALRCIMGFAVGGEYTGVVAYLMEGAPPRRRGLVASLASAASEVGALLAVAVSALTVHALSQADMDAWGWRIPFLFGSALALGVWLARSTMQESPDFERQRALDTIPRQPLRYALAHHRTGILRGFAISALGSITYYVGITYVPAYLTSVGRMGEALALWMATVAAVVVIAITPLVGALSDRVGRRPVLVGLALMSAILPATLFSVMANGSQLQALLGAVALAAVAAGVSAVGAVSTAEQFPGEGRLTGLALGATTATAFFGGLTPYVAQIVIERTGWAMTPGIMIAIVGLCVLPLLISMPETAPAKCPLREPYAGRG
ncbi:MFS transporter [Brevundimonas variabilis]|uniref:MHS family proline/betaine transporter-like MFS transporter n=1 Tax=Brevundimonas variabilis TaxID=74312 RepID=A0A7W9CKY5_9CAUL|nr:MFS transporter [Brevundimonas variabilis]MBB5747615.1 MHS family proline/betaine transporter-like MFS transporter [Brevundimonas variabilis]